jgi:peptidoglycan hydrolase CwlO-like protein
MARTFLNSSTQIGKSKEYDDTLTPSQALETGAETLQDDLNALRSMVKAAVGKGDWYAAPTADLESVNTAVGTAQSDITALETDVGTLQTDLATAQGNISTLQTDLDAAEGNIAILEANVSTLTTEQGNLGITVAGLVTGLATTDANVSGLDARLGTAEGEIDTLQSSLATTQGDVSTLQSSLSTAETNISTLQSSLSAAEGNISTLQTDLDAAEGSISTLQSDVLTAQGDISTLQTTVATHGTDISTLQGQVTTLEGSSTSQGSAISTLQGEVSTLQSNVGTLQNDVGTLQSDLDTAEGDISTLQSDVSAAQGDISTLQSDLSALSGNVILKDGSVAFTGDQSMGGWSLTDLASPSTALDAANKAYVDSVAQGLKILAPVDAKYNFEGGVQPSVPSLPTEPASSTYLGTIYTVTTEAELTAALGQCIDGDQIFVPSNTTVTLTSVKTINKSIKIFGGKQSSSVFSASFAVAANSGLFIISGKKADGVTQNNGVTFENLTITSSSNAADHACVTANTLSTAFPNGSIGIRFEECTFNHTEFGVTVAADSWVVKGCTFNYLPVTGAADTSRHLGIYNIGQMGWVENCSFPATTEQTPRTIAMLLTASDYDFTPGATKSGGFSGDFVVKGCSQASGNLRQWLVMEVFKANGLNSAPMAEHQFNFWAINNTHGNTSGGSHNFYEGSGTKAPLNFFGTMYVSGNQIGATASGAKGMLALDGLGTVRAGGAPTHFYINEPNVGGEFSQNLRAGYINGASDAQDPANGVNTLGVNTAVFSSPSTVPNNPIAIEAPASGGPVVPSGTSVNVGGYTAQAGDRIFVVNAFSAVQSGIYVCDAGDWPRAADYADGRDAASTFFFVSQGDYADTSWVEVGDPAIVGTNDLTFAQFSGAGTYTGTGAISVSAQNVISVSTGGITNDMLAGSIELSKLADGVYTTTEVDQALGLRLALSGGTMDANSLITFTSDSGAITGLADLTANSLDSAAANKKYVDEAVAAADARTSKTYAVVTAQNGVPAGFDLFNGQNGNLDAALPAMPSVAADLSSKFDIYLNGQLLRVGNQMDVERSANNPNALVLSFQAAAGDTLCIVEYA